MKSYCKNINIEDRDYIKKQVTGFIYSRNKKQRPSLAGYLREFNKDIPKNELIELIKQKSEKLEPYIEAITDELTGEINNRQIVVKPVKYEERTDHNSGKKRLIGLQSTKHKIYDYIAAQSLMPLYKAKIGTSQFASIEGRGQVKGKQTIEKWLRSEKLNLRYCIKADIKKCYESMPLDVIYKVYEGQVKNKPLLWLLRSLLGLFEYGLLIGSPLSMWTCNYILSFVYHYIKECLHKIRRTKLIPLVRKVAFFMDDFALFGSSLSDLKRAFKSVRGYIYDNFQLIVKDDYRIFRLEYLVNGVIHGQPVDMMGYRMGIVTTIRRRIFLRTRRCLLRIKRSQMIRAESARRLVSYIGWIVNSNMQRFYKSYIQLITKAKGVIRHGTSYIYSTAGAC